MMAGRLQFLPSLQQNITGTNAVNRENDLVGTWPSDQVMN